MRVRTLGPTIHPWHEVLFSHAFDRRIMSLFGKKYACQSCGMKFGSEADLSQHNAVHMASKPTAPAGPACPTCGASFRNQDELRAHSRQRHEM